MRSIKTAVASQAGFTLIEVLVTLMVFAVGLSGFAAMQTMAMREAVDSQQRSLAVWRSQELVDRIRANPEAVDAYVTEMAAIDCAAPVAKVCADHYGAGAVSCTADETAAYDIWNVLCSGTSTQQSGTEGLDDMLIGLTTTLICSDTPCEEDSDLTLTLEWTSQAARGNKVIAQSTAAGAADPFAQTLTTAFRP